MRERVVCDCCGLIVENKSTHTIKDKNMSGVVICKFCLNDNNPNHVDQQIAWLNSLKNKRK